MKELWQLFSVFFRIGGLTFGGGYAMLPMLQKEVVERRGWSTEDEMMDYFAIGQCTPGIIAVNVATFVGYRQRKISGAAAATIGVVCPSLIIITIIAAFINGFSHIPAVTHALSGIRIIVCALILQAVVKLWKANVKGAFGFTLLLCGFLLVVILGISPVFVVLGSALVGIISGFIKGRKNA